MSNHSASTQETHLSPSGGSVLGHHPSGKVLTFPTKHIETRGPAKQPEPTDLNQLLTAGLIQPVVGHRNGSWLVMEATGDVPELVWVITPMSTAEYALMEGR